MEEREAMLKTKAIVSICRNNKALRIPDEMSHRLELRSDDEVVLEVRENILTVSKLELPAEGTIEYLFKDYSGEFPNGTNKPHCSAWVRIMVKPQTHPSKATL